MQIFFDKGKKVRLEMPSFREAGMPGLVFNRPERSYNEEGIKKIPFLFFYKPT